MAQTIPSVVVDRIRQLEAEVSYWRRRRRFWERCFWAAVALVVLAVGQVLALAARCPP